MLFAAGTFVIRESRIGSNENVIFDANTIPKLNAVLYRDPIPDNHIVFYEYLGANVAVAAYCRLGQYDDKLPDRRIVADLIRLDVSEWVNRMFQLIVPVSILAAR